MIENGIRQGLEQDEFEVWYQPVVDADTLAMTGVEALLRWPRRPQVRWRRMRLSPLPRVAA